MSMGSTMSSVPIANASAGRILRNLSLLALCQALAQSGNVVVIATAALAAQSIEGNDFSWTTLPITVQHVGVMLSVFPAALLGQHRGRAFSFGLGALAGMAGAALCSLAIWLGS